MIVAQAFDEAVLAVSVAEGADALDPEAEQEVGRLDKIDRNLLRPVVGVDSQGIGEGMLQQRGVQQRCAALGLDRQEVLE